MTQWPDYRFWLRGTGTSRHEADPSRAADKRALDRLMDAARGWSERGGKDEDLQGGGELAEFERLAKDRAGWLSPSEREFVARSVEARERGRSAEQRAAQQLENTRSFGCRGGGRLGARQGRACCCWYSPACATGRWQRLPLHRSDRAPHGRRQMARDWHEAGDWLRRSSPTRSASTRGGWREPALQATEAATP